MTQEKGLTQTICSDNKSMSGESDREEGKEGNNILPEFQPNVASLCP